MPFLPLFSFGHFSAHNKKSLFFGRYQADKIKEKWDITLPGNIDQGTTIHELSLMNRIQRLVDLLCAYYYFVLISRLFE
jgi:hypothetical protein